MSNVAAPFPRILSLCSGVGMLDEGVRLAVPGARIVGHVERDAYVAAVLLARMEDEALEPAPVWCGNLEDFGAGAWVGAVDGITAGFPCPPVSSAGKRRGVDDERWIFPDIMRIVRAVGPRWIFLENVGGLLSANAGREFGEVLRLLAEGGYDAEWLALRASDVGAPHERQRLFILAYAKGERCEEVGGEHWRRSKKRIGECGEKKMAHSKYCPGGTELEQQHGERANESRGGVMQMGDSPSARCRGGESKSGGPFWDKTRGYESSGRRDGVAYTGSERHEGFRTEWPEAGPVGRGGGAEVPDAEGRRRDQTFRRGEGGIGPFPPGPGDVRGWERVIGETGYLAPAVESGLRMLVDGMAMVVDESRADQLRCAGNGVVALQAAVAFTVLDRRAGIGLTGHGSGL